MRWNPLRKRDPREAGERFREEHSRFLTKALLLGNRIPRIPTRRVDKGGFSAMSKRENGESRANQWWGAVFDRVD